MITLTSRARPVHWSLLLATALAVTLFLYFIDEGRYSLQGLLTWGNTIAMGVYLLGMMLGLFLVSRLFATRHPSPARTVLVLLLGTALGFLLGLLLMLGVGVLQLLG
ncbi:MAG: hypothetical protein JNM62_05175 [Flavobacteriales bacterium]|nr:hypothetical protein [Flavobacteriales bacterium]